MAQPTYDSSFSATGEYHDDTPSFWPGLTRAALLISLALVVVRCTQMESIRDPIAAIGQGLQTVPKTPGAAASVLLALVGVVPAMLVCLRATFDRSFAICWQAWHVPAALLGMWCVASVNWSGDRYVALINSLNFVSGLLTLWAVSQCARSWRAHRLVSGVVVGLLMIFVVQAMVYRFVEWPDLVETWKSQRATFFAERGWAETSFAAQQFERNITNRALLGFFNSPNTYAASALLAAFVTIGVIVQRKKDGDDTGWVAPGLVALVGGGLLLAWTGSRTAMLGGVIGAGVFLLWYLFLRARSQRLFTWLIAVGLFVLAGIAVISVGLSTGGLGQDSLTFRWRYWLGAFDLFKSMPWLGTGWSNFGAGYLMHRLPVAAEEIKDPHNVFVRFATELGVIGFMLSIAWLALLTFALSVPRLRSQLHRQSVHSYVRPIAPQGLLFFCILVTGLMIIFAVDLSANPHYVFIEVLKRLLFGGVFALGLMTTCVRISNAQAQLDIRPSPWIVWTTVVGVGVFLLHSMIDMVMLETGPLLLFAAVVGSLVGIRSRKPRFETSAAKREALVAGASLVVVGSLTVLAGVLIVIPVMRAEAASARAIELMSQSRLAGAVESLEKASKLSPVANSDFHARTVELLLLMPPPIATRVLEEMNALIQADPTRFQSHLERARYRLSNGLRDANVLEDYTRVVALNPRDPRLRLEFAQLLRSVGKTSEANQQVRAALATNDAYDPNEPRRLSPAEVDELRAVLTR